MDNVAFPSARILIVDDEIGNVLLLEKLLSKSGYRNLRTTTDSHDVIPLMEWNPDLILLDLQMPVLDGYAVMEQLSPWISTYKGSYLPILVLTADATPAAKERSLSMGARDFLTKPFDRTEVLLRINNLLETRSLHLQLRDENTILDEKVQERTAELMRSVNRLEQAGMELKQSREETVRKLALAAEFRDDDTAQHIARMSEYTALLGELTGMRQDEVELLRLASVMHDVGKIGIPDAILLKAGKLTADEYDIMKTHAKMGHRILDGSVSPLLLLASEIALTHHEHYDGSGYPNGLAGDDIPESGRIAAIADVFDALTSNRVYRRALPVDDAVEIMKSDTGHFDPKLLQLFTESLGLVVPIMQTIRDSARQFAS